MLEIGDRVEARGWRGTVTGVQPVRQPGAWDRLVSVSWDEAPIRATVEREGALTAVTV